MEEAASSATNQPNTPPAIQFHQSFHFWFIEFACVIGLVFCFVNELKSYYNSIHRFESFIYCYNISSHSQFKQWNEISLFLNEWKKREIEWNCLCCPLHSAPLISRGEWVIGLASASNSFQSLLFFQLYSLLLLSYSLFIQSHSLLK